MKYFCKLIFIVLSITCAALASSATPFEVVTPKAKVSIVYAAGSKKLDSIAAYLLAGDIQRVTGYLPKVYTSLNEAKGNVIVIGTVGGQMLGSMKNAYDSSLKGTWERYSIKLLSNPLKNIQKALVIAGSDERGMAYGVFSISEKIGISPWYWWADVTPTVKKQLSIDITSFTSATPSVKFRGIFINDEDWGLQPWAAKTFEPETGDIGPKTYAKVFELLLRLKANLIWPAMHPSTKPFYSYPGNKQVAADYEIVVGSSHAEPMLRNNVGEWDEKTMGHFNYLTNKATVYNYWESRVKESSANNVMYTIGMRGVHDSGMEGVKSNKEAIPLLQKIFEDQRGLMQKYTGHDATRVPQVFTVYKEVLDIYEAGLPVPDDVTLVWPDDNYGYIQRLSSADENKRSGGSGVYYHASYWGRPHDYLWLSSTHPGLIREEMVKAYNMNARNLWVVNVGDIKPGEYDLQLFADMAYNVTPFQQSSYSATHLSNWVAGIFGSKRAPAISKMLWKYYDLAFERKPEFMGWSQTEPTTPTKLTAYDHFSYGDQAQRRIDAYDQLQRSALATSKLIDKDKQDTYFQLVEYPLTGASLINKKFLYHDKAVLYAQQGRLSAKAYQQLSEGAYNDIVKQTDRFNNDLAGGKWKNIMSMQPRNLPVYKLPEFDLAAVKAKEPWLVIPEGDKTVKEQNTFTLPQFDRWNKQRYFVDVFLSKDATTELTITPSANWIKMSKQAVTLSGAELQSQQRIWVDIDWATAPKQQIAGKVVIKGADRSVTININADNTPVTALSNYKGIVATGDHAAINATSFTTLKNAGNSQWKVIDRLGSSGSALEAMPLTAVPNLITIDYKNLKERASVSYEFYIFDAVTNANFNIYTLPTFPLNKNFEMRYGVSIDGGELEVLNFKTVGRTEEWKQNVLSNSAVRTVKNKQLKAGKHSITIYQIDPGVILDRIFIDLGNALPYYGALPENVHQ